MKWKILFCFCVIIRGSSIAQSSADSMAQTMPYPVAIYYDSLGEQSPLFNGREYVDYAGTIQKGHPFFGTTEFVKGVLHYDGMVYNDAMILFDIIKEKVLVRHFNNVFRIDMPVEKVSEFILPGHHFVRLYPDSAGVVTEGFYEKLYQGKTKLYVKRKKEIRVDRTGNDIINVVDEKDVFYILKQGRFHAVNTRGGLLRVLGDKRDGIRQHLKRSGIKFRHNRELAVVTAVQFYDK